MYLSVCLQAIVYLTVTELEKILDVLISSF